MKMAVIVNSVIKSRGSLHMLNCFGISMPDNQISVLCKFSLYNKAMYLTDTSVAMILFLISQISVPCHLIRMPCK